MYTLLSKAHNCNGTIMHTDTLLQQHTRASKNHERIWKDSGTSTAMNMDAIAKQCTWDVPIQLARGRAIRAAHAHTKELCMNAGV